MEILCIGNSFSRDSSTYLHGIAKNAGDNINVVNLYIGGCALSTHFRNMMSGERAYELQVNGVATGFKVSLEEALLNRCWDYISFQQASHFSTNYETYQPYLERLCAWAKELCPKAKKIIHQTWAYENGSERLIERLGYESHDKMFSDIKVAYKKASESIDADLVIESGELFCKLVSLGFKVHEDTFHASLGTGRYALGLLWYKKLTGKSVIDNGFSDFLCEIDSAEIEKIKELVEAM